MTFNSTPEAMTAVEGFGEAHQSTIDTIAALLDGGHDVEVTDDGRVIFTPSISADMTDHLSASPSEVRAAIIQYGRELLRSDLLARR